MTDSPTSKQDFEPCYCVRCDGKLPAPCRYDQGTQSREERVLSDAIDMCEGWSAHVGGIGQEAIAALRKLRSELSAPAQLEFKNFHRLLCERFGYVHDEKDWRRDQLSLIEHIAKRYSWDGTTEQPCPVHGDQACLRWYLKGAHAHPSASDALEWADKELEDSEELACMEGDLRLPKLARAREALNRASVETTEPIVETTAAHWLGELLAVIHRDGGHYEGKHGAIVATQDAIKIVHVLRGDRNCKVCDGLGYSVGVAKRVTCDECDGTGLALLAEHSSPLEPEPRKCPKCERMVTVGCNYCACPFPNAVEVAHSPEKASGEFCPDGERHRWSVPVRGAKCVRPGCNAVNGGEKHGA